MVESGHAFAAMAGKVAQVTVSFWIVKIIATTLGETGGDALSMQLALGYQAATFIFLAFFVATVSAQVAVNRYRPGLYWAVIVATTTLGTTTADWMTRDLHAFGMEGLGYGRTALTLFILLLVVLAIWRAATGSVAINQIVTKRSEAFYWVAILVSNTLGTALGDWLADTNDVGFERGALVFASALAVVAGVYLFTKISRPILFWSAFILTRPLGATVGDILTKSHEEGGLDLGQLASSIAIAAVMIPLVLLFSRKPEQPAPDVAPRHEPSSADLD